MTRTVISVTLNKAAIDRLRRITSTTRLSQAEAVRLGLQLLEDELKKQKDNPLLRPEESDAARLRAWKTAPCATCGATIQPEELWQPGYNEAAICAACVERSLAQQAADQEADELIGRIDGRGTGG